MDLASLPVKIRFPRFAVAVHFTTEGAVFVFLSLAIGAAAVNTGNNVLYLIFSLMLGLIVVSGILSRRMLSGLSPRVDFPDHIFAGNSNVCYISIHNRKKKLPSVGIRFSIKIRNFPSIGRYFFFLPAAEETHGFAPVIFPRRGEFRLDQIELQTRFPFSFFLKIRRYFLTQQVLVYPRVYRLSEDIMTQLTEGMMMESPYHGDSQQLLHLRDYSPLDSRKRIHWKASAKIEKILVKEFQKEHGQDLYIYFNCYPEEEAHSLLFEKAISLIASVAFLLQEKEVAARIVFPDREFDLGAKGFSIVPLLAHLTALKIGPAPTADPILPSAYDAMAIEVRSLKIRPAFSLQWPRTRIAFIEDWIPGLRETISATEIKGKIE